MTTDLERRGRHLCTYCKEAAAYYVSDTGDECSCLCIDCGGV